MNPERTILGADQENWLGSQLAASHDRGSVWQVIGQQVLMGKLTTPLIPQETIDKMELPERYSKRLEGLQQIAEAKLPMNLDAWDGYPACRERIHGLFTQFAKNPVYLPAIRTMPGRSICVMAQAMPLVWKLVHLASPVRDGGLFAGTAKDDA